MTDRNDPAHQYGDEIDPCELTPEVEAALDRANDAAYGAAQEAVRKRRAEADRPAGPASGREDEHPPGAAR